MMNSISPLALKEKIDNNDNFQLIDIRENYEFESFNIGGINIPLNQVFSTLDKIEKDKTIIYCCAYGFKSKAIIHTIKRKLKLEDIYSLEGGIEAYAAEIG